MVSNLRENSLSVWGKNKHNLMLQNDQINTCWFQKSKKKQQWWMICTREGKDKVRI